MRIVQVATFVGPRSGGIRTVLRHLAEGYAAAGHDVVQVVPGPQPALEHRPWGAVVTVPAPPVPGTGYRVVVRPAAVERLLERLAPDRVEVHDRTTLRGLGDWARGHGARSLVVSHERLDRVLRQWVPALPVPAAERAADRSNASLAASYDRVVCTTRWAGEEFARLGVPPATVPLGVELDRFHPDRASREVRAVAAPAGEALLLTASRLSREKRPDLAVDAAAELARRGRPVRLVVAGDGACRRALARRARGLPVRLVGFLDDRDALARLLATADVVLAPGPVETFGLAALEALASGTPVVAHEASAVGEVLAAGAGLTAAGTPSALADAVEAVLDGAASGAAARARAEAFPWERTVAGFLDLHREHGLPAPVPAPRPAPVPVR
ncbi:glycosyltransferase [Vallicoccus soli]|uniref:Glycosyltransferase n=1 Tax=Vallicoccus soli TaxID=2339232 RepID=A0A3A3Z1J5_9ACTN|nr:glycosyltransferase [Vallicoccus soli]RJK94267.1 glycosyltransferase [Vallicoccus soli]